MVGFKKSIGMWVLSILLILTASPVMAQTEGDTVPSGLTYNELSKEIESYIEANKNTTASVQLAVFKGQDTKIRINFGYKNRETKEKVNSQTVYEWGSCTKLLTWVSLMQLYEEGKLRLDEDIRLYLPENFLNKLKFDKPITMQHLMNHTAGFQETTYNVETGNIEEVVDLEQALRQTQPTQIYEPGSVCAYSNWGSALAGFIVEEISGQTFYDYVNQHIFRPLGMEHTALAPDLSDNKWVQEQRKTIKTYYMDDLNDEDLGINIRHILLYPAGMATGTMDDFIKFSKAFLVEENVSTPLFKERKTLDLMLSPTLFYGNTDMPRVCHGMWTLEFGVTTLGHGGNTAGFTANLQMDMASKTGVVIMSNQVAETVYTNAMLPLIFGQFESDARGEALPATDTLSGVYASSRTIKKGMMKIYSVIGSLLPLSSSEDPNTLHVMIGSGSVKQVAPFQYLFNMGKASYFMYASVLDDDTPVFQMMSQDFIKQNPFFFFSKVAMLLLGFLAFVFCGLTVLIWILITAIKKILRKEKSNDPLRPIRLLTALSGVLIGILFAWVVTSSSLTQSSMWWKCSLNGLIAGIPIINTVIYIINHKKWTFTKWQGIHAVLTLVSANILSLNVIYWETFNFWTF